MSNQEEITRIRVEYTKEDSLRFTGHLDLQRLWERALRRSGLPVRYSQGYNPRARLNLASALPLGFTSQVELLDFWMDAPRPLTEVRQRLSASVPEGIRIKSVREVDLREDALQTRMKASQYLVTFFETQNPHGLKARVEALKAAETILRTRRKKTYDLRPLILALEITPAEDDAPALFMHLIARPGATGRPDEVMESLGFPNTDYLVRRTALILDET